MVGASGVDLTRHEESALGPASRVETRPKMCPEPVKGARKETWRQEGLAKTLGKSREA